MPSAFSPSHAREMSITAVDGVLVGHATHADDATGCTVVRLPEGTAAGVDIRGGGCATHETDLLDPTGITRHADAFVLCGSSAPGLGCIQGVVDWNREHGLGFATQHGVVPIIPGAAIYDLSVGSPDRVPTPADAHHACESAAAEFERGSVGAGAGASVGKVAGPSHAMKSGIGSAGWVTQDGLSVGALAVVNAFGDILDDARIIAGARTDKDVPLDTQAHLIAGGGADLAFGTNTTLVVVATNAVLDKAQANALARIAHAGMPRAVRPCHTQYDGDLVFAAATGTHDADINRAGALAARLVECAIVDAALRADAFGEIPSATSIGWARRQEAGE